MNKVFGAAMREATRLTRSLHVAEATRLIQEALRGVDPRHPPGPRAGEGPADHGGPLLDLTATDVTRSDRRAPEPPPSADPGPRTAERRRATRPLGDVVGDLAKARSAFRVDTGRLAGRRVRPEPALPDGARYEARSRSAAGGERPYKLYVPAALAGGEPAGIVLMLHGCKQNPDDFAVGTRMNALAEEHRLVVAYPGQVQSANVSGCWNWFNPADQVRGAGEPSILAAIATDLAGEFAVPDRRIFVAGLSAGGAMAAVLAETYPDLFAACGIHSGLAHGSARDVATAFAAMRGDGAGDLPGPSAAGVRTIVFHGSGDRTVHPSNGDRIVSAAIAERGLVIRTETGSAGGRRYDRRIYENDEGTAVAEHWSVHGGAHAWFGGDPAGSYTDPRGPDATAEMVRFFLSA